jgi:NAD-dependent DNA ligase
MCKPVQIEGKVFSRISVNNISYIIENNLRIGSPIAFNLRSAANVVLDVTATADLQRRWKGKYDEFKSYVSKEIM